MQFSALFKSFHKNHENQISKFFNESSLSILQYIYFMIIIQNSVYSGYIIVRGYWLIGYYLSINKLQKLLHQAITNP